MQVIWKNLRLLLFPRLAMGYVAGGVILDGIGLPLGSVILLSMLVVVVSASGSFSTTDSRTQLRSSVA